MLKVSKAEKVKYPKPCAWCDQAVQFGPFTHGKVKDTDTRSVLLHGDLAVPGSCAYKFAQGQLPLPTATVESTLTIAPKPDIEDYIEAANLILRGDIAKVEARIKNMEEIVDRILTEVQGPPVQCFRVQPDGSAVPDRPIVQHPANEVE